MLTKTPSELQRLTDAPQRTRRTRDPRLDFFRGVGMFIILIAHIPNNTWTLWIPARFGFSDATEMFVFLSGMASAIAFGRVFDAQGFFRGTARIAYRIWQVYWAHIAVFLVVASIMAVAVRPDGSSYVQSLNLTRFFADPGPLLPGLMTLTYVPNYFDILPMYLVILALLPLMLAAERAGRWLPFALMGTLWLAAQAGLLNLPAEPWSQRTWFFNPFGWQLCFFLGFFIMRGTLQVPGPSRRLMAVALLVVVATVPFAWYKILNVSPWFADAARALLPLTDKTHFGILRLVHFLALAYLAANLVGEGGRHLVGMPVRVISRVGQQSLAVFVSGMVLAQLLGIALDYSGRTAFGFVVANLFGFAVLIAVAYAVDWFKTLRSGG